MKVVNLSGCVLKDSQFEEIKISKYYSTRFQALMMPILSTVNPNRLSDDQLQTLVRTVVESDKLKCCKVVIAFSIMPSVRHRIAKAFTQVKYDVYVATLNGENCVWIDPR